MTGERDGNGQWRQATVLIRADILARAQEAGIDISSECNRALADRLGIDVSQQKIPEPVKGQPVIIAKEPPAPGTETGSGSRTRNLRPVLNAEDPRAPAHVMKMKREPLPAVTDPLCPERLPEKMPSPEGPITVPQPTVKAPRSPRHGEQKKEPGRKGKDDLVREFLAKKVIRDESGGAGELRIAKDELYQIFVRFCRATKRQEGPVPDRRAFAIALKNRFVMEDTIADGIQYWNNVKLR